MHHCVISSEEIYVFEFKAWLGHFWANNFFKIKPHNKEKEEKTEREGSWGSRRGEVETGWTGGTKRGKYKRQHQSLLVEKLIGMGAEQNGKEEMCPKGIFTSL